MGCGVVSRQWVLDFARPDEWIIMNERIHWAPKAAKTRTWRSVTASYARSEGIPRLDRAHIVVQPCFTRQNRTRDITNWMPTAKACVDGLTDAGLWLDDDDAHVVGPDLRPGPTVKGLARIRITITELDPTGDAA